MLRLLILSIALCTAELPLNSSQLVPHGRIEHLPHRMLDNAPMPRYQAGYVFSRDSSMSSIWIDPVGAQGGEPVDHAIKLPNSIRLIVSDVAVSYDGSVAVCASAVDRDGRLVSAIAWIGPDGSSTRIVRTSPFSPTGIGFTADGSLWAAGVQKISRSEWHPSHDVVRQYDSDGKLVRSLLSRAEFSDDQWHPAYAAQVATSRHYVALVSRQTGDWTLISSAGAVIRTGAIGLSGDFRIGSAAVTDSGRLFASGMWPNDRHSALFEIGSQTVRVDPTGFLPDERIGPVVGSDGESLVFLGREHGFVWADLK